MKRLLREVMPQATEKDIARTAHAIQQNLLQQNCKTIEDDGLILAAKQRLLYCRN